MNVCRHRCSGRSEEGFIFDLLLLIAGILALLGLLIGFGMMMSHFAFEKVTFWGSAFWSGFVVLVLAGCFYQSWRDSK